MHQELAGLGNQGDVSFLKHELNASYHQPLDVEKKVVFSTTVKAGLFSPLNDKKQNPTVSDRFYLGGPTSVRGFKMGGIGERDGSK